MLFRFHLTGHREALQTRSPYRDKLKKVVKAPNVQAALWFAQKLGPLFEAHYPLTIRPKWQMHDVEIDADGDPLTSIDSWKFWVTLPTGENLKGDSHAV